MKNAIADAVGILVGLALLVPITAVFIALVFFKW